MWGRRWADFCVQTRLLAVPALCLSLAGCMMTSLGDPGSVEAPTKQVGVAFAPTYEPIETQLLDVDLVSFKATVHGARGPGDLRDATDCAAAQYALIRGYGYARHIRTNLSVEGVVWEADAAYTISIDLPRGTNTLDAAATVTECQARGLPTF